jgi:hypothetical protein
MSLYSDNATDHGGWQGQQLLGAGLLRHPKHPLEVLERLAQLVEVVVRTADQQVNSGETEPVTAGRPVLARQLPCHRLNVVEPCQVDTWIVGHQRDGDELHRRVNAASLVLDVIGQVRERVKGLRVV